MVKNAVGRELPEKIGNYVVKPYKGPGAELDWDKPACTNRVPRLSPAGGSKVAASLKDAIIKSGLKDGQTISFHHCFREGDHIIGQVLTAIRDMGIRHLRFALGDGAGFIQGHDLGFARFLQRNGGFEQDAVPRA